MRLQSQDCAGFAMAGWAGAVNDLEKMPAANLSDRSAQAAGYRSTGWWNASRSLMTSSAVDRISGSWCGSRHPGRLD